MTEIGGANYAGFRLGGHNCELFKTPKLYDDNAYIAANG